MAADLKPVRLKSRVGSSPTPTSINQGSYMEKVTVYYLEPFFAKTDFCCICEKEVVIHDWATNYSIPMYEGAPVPKEWDGEWGGFCACKDCYDKYEYGDLKMWSIEDLRISQEVL